MEYITADTGGKKVYIEKDQIETILTRPEVWPVPEAEDNILAFPFMEMSWWFFIGKEPWKKLPAGLSSGQESGFWESERSH